jgi:hypothetical protein
MRKLIPVALTEALDKENKESGEASVAADRGIADRPHDRVYGPPWKTDVDAWYEVHEELASALDAT